MVGTKQVLPSIQALQSLAVKKLRCRFHCAESTVKEGKSPRTVSHLAEKAQVQACPLSH